MTHTLIRAGSALALAAAGWLLAAPASAAPIYLVDFTTDGQPPDANLSNDAFFLSYEDSNGDKRFALPELLAFTGYSDALGNFYSLLLAVPDGPGLLGNDSAYVFGDGSGGLGPLRVDATAFTAFTTGPLAGSVPEPGSFALAGLALAGLAFGSRRRA